MFWVKIFQAVFTSKFYACKVLVRSYLLYQCSEEKTIGVIALCQVICESALFIRAKFYGREFA